jgi:cell division protein FtsB
MWHRVLIALIVLVILGLQAKLWFGDGSVRTIVGLKQAVSAQQAENDNLKKRNDQLSAEVKNLKEGTDAIEERARNDLGMIGRNETFFQVADTPEGNATITAAKKAPGNGPGNGQQLAPPATPAAESKAAPAHVSANNPAAAAPAHP